MTEMPVSLAETPISNGAASGLVWAFRIHADGTPEPLSIDAPIESHHDGWLWLHFNLADARACALLSNLEGLPPEAARLPEGNRQLYVDDSCVYGVFTDLINDVDGVTREFGYLHFAMTERILISARRHAMSAAERARQALAGGRKLTRVASLLELIIDHVADSIGAYADRLDEGMDEIEEELWLRNASDQRQKLSGVRKATVHLHQQLQGLLALFQRVGGGPDSEARQDLRLKTSALLQRLEGLAHDIVAMRERAHLLQEEVTLKITEDTDRSLTS
jgi:zinc transporter